MTRSGRYRLARQLPGGIRTHQESTPFHGELRKSGLKVPYLVETISVVTPAIARAYTGTAKSSGPRANKRLA